jgi:hypothetical protein
MSRTPPPRPEHPVAAEQAPKATRRHLLAGLGAAGAAGVAATALPLAKTAAPAAEASAALAAAPEAGGGYQLSAHVLRYYQTTRV